ncbi:MAG: transposase [Deltaproteobacteria bacterium]|nr:transposase [Deltaproteobacteria bacterium]
MPNYRRCREGTTYFFTVVTHRRRPILCDTRSRRALRDAIADARAAHPFAIEAWVLLPEHLHCLWRLPDEDRDYSLRWALIKAGFTKRIRAWLDTPETCRSRERHREAMVWQRRFWEHTIRDDRDFAAHCDYVHWNPVKHGLAAAPKDWPHSTFHRFVEKGIYTACWGADPPRLPEGVGQE